MRQIRFARLALAGLLGVGCGSSGPDDGRCEDVQSMQASPGLTPALGWTPSCTVAQVRVTRLADQQAPEAEVWAVVATENVITGPVNYGTPPAGAIETTTDVPLVAGKTYRFVVAVRDPDSGLLIVAGLLDFTP